MTNFPKTFPLEEVRGLAQCLAKPKPKGVKEWKAAVRQATFCLGCTLTYFDKEVPKDPGVNAFDDTDDQELALAVLEALPEKPLRTRSIIDEDTLKLIIEFLYRWLFANRNYEPPAPAPAPEEEEEEDPENPET